MRWNRVKISYHCLDIKGWKINKKYHLFFEKYDKKGIK